MFRFSLSLLVLCCLALPCNADDGLTAWAKKMQGRHAYGQYVGGKKAGFTIEELKLGKHDGKDVLTYVIRDYFAMRYEGDETIKDETTTHHYELVGKGELLYAKRERKENDRSITYELTRQKKGMRLSIRQGKRTETRDVSMPKDNLAVARGLQEWLARPRKNGDKYVNYRLDWESDENGHLDQSESYVFEKKITTKVYGKDVAAFAVTVVIEGGKLISEMLPDGRLIRGKIGNLLSVELEKEAIAKKMEGPPPELAETTSVALDRDLGQASLVTELKLELTGLGDFEIPESHRQIVKKDRDKVVLTIKRDFRVEKAVGLTKNEQKTYLAATPRVQSEHKAIVAKAKEIVGEEKDALAKAKLLSSWVYDNLKKSYSVNPERAIDVLESKVGACREHTLLFVSLARAVGVPAREVGGLAFTRQNDKPLMGWHAWAEIHDGHQWVSIDATWNQTYVDGTHVKMSEGDKDQTWANVAGELKIKVVDVVKRR